MALLLIAEHDQEKLTPSTLATLTAAKQFSVPIHIVLIGHSCQKVAEEASRYEGVEKVWIMDHPSLLHPIAEEMTDTLLELAKGYGFVLAPSSTFGKNLLPRLAALLDVAQISDVIQIVDRQTFVRPIYAGNALATVLSQDDTKVMTIRSTAFDKAEKGSSKAPIEAPPFKPPSFPHATFVKIEKSSSKRPELTSASIVVSGGRGLQTKENFEMLETLADLLGAAIGASRAAVDAGFVPNDYQVGQTGKVVAPDLYIAIGISGAIQHLAGMQESKVIVALNKDPEAPIFQVADYGLVGDLFTILPELIEKLKMMKKADLTQK
ncbi:MAG: electron transfer flavoprotein subunit alpha/FixB family protein [Alphaproteobacteria bacterium]|nr:electron transfer flavoprotein subunit alpha/FixB family protein [Alphaproteobacteria bacterium]